MPGNIIVPVEAGSPDWRVVRGLTGDVGLPIGSNRYKLVNHIPVEGVGGMVLHFASGSPDPCHSTAYDEVGRWRRNADGILSLIYRHVPTVRSSRSTPRARNVEIVGAAGTGKSTVYHALLRRHEKEIVGWTRLSRLRYGPLIVGETLPKLWRLVYRYPGGRSVRAEQIRKLVYLRVLSRVLERQDHTGMRARVLDQGPIHLLTKICELGPLEDLERWWIEGLHRWATLLDIVVWLDAPDAVLLERINMRRKPHALKGASHEHAREALVLSRRLHKQTISELIASGSAKVLRFDTSRDEPDTVVDTITRALK